MATAIAATHLHHRAAPLAPLGHPRLPRARPAHGRARRDDRQRRDALDPAVARVLERRPPVARHRVLARLRQPPVPRRPAERPARTQDRPCRSGLVGFAVRLGARRRGAELLDARRRSRDPGRVRRGARARRARDGDDDVHRPRGARQGVRHLRLDRGRGRGDRPPARRHPHPVPRLALVPLRQPVLRGRRARRHPDPARPRARDGERRARRAEHAAHLGRALRDRLRAEQRRELRADAIDLAAGRRDARRRRSRTRRRSAAWSSGSRWSGSSSGASRASSSRCCPLGVVTRPGARRVVPLDPHRRGVDVLHVLLPHLLPPGDPRLLAGAHRPRVPADGRRALGDRRDRARRSPAAGSGRGRSSRPAWRSAPSGCDLHAPHRRRQLPHPRAPRAARRSAWRWASSSRRR